MPAQPAPAASRLLLLALVACALVEPLAGCGRTSITAPLASSLAAPEGADVDEIDFWHELPNRTVVANGDALVGLIFLATGGTASAEGMPLHELIGADYAQRVEYAKRRGWVDDNFFEAQDLAVRRGVVARALADICRIRGGVMMRIAGRNERYATRELEYLGILPPGSPNQVIAGGEFIGLISQAQDYVNFKQFGPLPGVAATLRGDPDKPAPGAATPEPATPPADTPADPSAAPPQAAPEDPSAKTAGPSPGEPEPPPEPPPELQPELQPEPSPEPAPPAQPAPPPGG